MTNPASNYRMVKAAMSLLLACACLLQPAAAESALLAKVRAGNNVKVVLLGTSLTASATWPASLQSWLSSESPGPGTVTVVNRAASGQASDHGLAVQTPAALADNPDCVFIEFSMNDAATTKNMTQQQSESNLNAIIDAFVAQKPNIIIVLQTMNNVAANTSPFSPRPELAAYYQIYRNVASARGAILIDHYPNWLNLFTNDLATWNSYMTDAVHPNTLGQNTVLMPELKEVLGPPSEPPPPTGNFLVAWDDWVNLSGSNTAQDDTGVTGFSGNVVSSRNLSGAYGSTDGTYGSTVTGANATNIRALLPNSANPSTSVTITNNTGQPYSINSLHFDVVQRDGSARAITVTYASGGLGPASTQILNATYTTITSSTTTILHQYDLALGSSLTDTVLDNGESATFQIVLGDFEGTNSTFIDNMAIRGTPGGGPANTAPSWLSNPVTETQATQDNPYSSTLADNATDADSDPLTFAKVNGPSWLIVAANGALSGTPGNGDTGANSFTVSVSDGIAAPVTTSLNITVAYVNDAPVFGTDPFSAANATVDAAYNATIAGAASDPDGDPLTYAKTGGPGWLVVNPNGTLSGTPNASDEGLNSFTVSASDGIAAPVEATLNITVATAPPPLSGDMLAAWDAWSDTSNPHVADVFASGIASTVAIGNNQNRYNSGFGSTDGTFGTSLTGASTSLGALLIRARDGANVATIEITNNTGSPISIKSLHFDYEVRAALPNYSPRNFILTYAGGGLGPAGTGIASMANLDVGGYDFDYALGSVLADTILDNGESAAFVLEFTNWGPASIDISGVLDNIAIVGSPAVATIDAKLYGFTYDPATGDCAISIKGPANMAFKLVEADDLDFANPDQDPVPLATATVGTLDGNRVITTAAGDATVQFNLGTEKSAAFVRAQEVP